MSETYKRYTKPLNQEMSSMLASLACPVDLKAERACDNAETTGCLVQTTAVTSKKVTTRGKAGQTDRETIARVLGEGGCEARMVVEAVIRYNKVRMRDGEVKWCNEARETE